MLFIARYPLLLGFVLAAFSSFGQIAGPAAATAGSTQSYSVTTGDISGWSFSATGGTVSNVNRICGDVVSVVSQPTPQLNQINTGASPFNFVPPPCTTYTYSCTVTWGSGSLGTLFFKSNGSIIYSDPVLLCPATPNPPSGISFSISQCNGISISYSGTIPDNTNWYWQTSSSGTSTSNATTSMTSSVSGNFYLRARTICGGWSSSSLAVNGNNGLVNVQTTPTLSVANNAPTICSGLQSTSITLSNPNGVSGTTYSWSVSSSNVSGWGNVSNTSSNNIVQPITSTTGNTAGSATYTITASAGGCTSGQSVATVNVNPTPTISLTNSWPTICSGQQSASISWSSNGVAGTTYSWTASPSNVNGSSSASGSSATALAQALTSATGNTAGSVSYSFSAASSNGCTSPSATTSVTVNPIPTLSVTNNRTTLCSGQQTTSITLSNPNGVAGTVYSWTPTSSNVSGASGVSGTSSTSIAQSITSTTGNTSGSVTYSITAGASGCSSPQSTTSVTVNPVPTLSLVNNASSICPGQSSSFTLSNPNSVSGTTYSYTVGQSNVTGASGATNTSSTSISQVLNTVTSSNSGTANYTVTAAANGCTSPSNTNGVTVKALPVLSITNNAASICSGISTNIGLSTSNGLSGTTYSWTPTQTGATGATAVSSTSSTTISQALSNSGNTTGNVVYSITPSTAGCNGSPGSTTVNVYPTPTAAITTQSPICSGTGTSLTITNPNSVSGTTLNWTTSPTNISGSAGGSGSNGTVIAQTLSSVTGNTVGSVVYAVTATANGCSGSPASTTVSVNPVPTAGASALNTTICSGGSATITFTNPNSVSGTTFDVEQVAINATIPYPDGTLISGTFRNLDGVNPASGVYTITPMTINCAGTPITATVNVGPLLVAPSTANFLAYGSNSVTLQVTVPTNAQARWYADNVTNTTLSTNPTYALTKNTTDTSFPTVYVSLRDLGSSCETSRTPMTGTYIAAISPASITQEMIRIPAVTTEDNVVTLNTTQKAVTVSYVDGLSRPSQVIALNATSSGNDLVKPIEYDSYGNTSKTYLPYSVAATSGAFQTTYAYDQAYFYDPTHGAAKVAHDGTPYAVSNYELSPLGRVLEQGSVGAAWQPGTQHTKRVAYSYNTGATGNDAEEVRKFATDGSSTGYFAINSLVRMQVTDENNNIDIVFKNGVGKTVARKQQVGHTAYLQTYYVYDDFDRLKYIIPPAGVAALKTNSWVLSSNIMDDHLHQFVYDNRGRLIQKKTPGQTWSYFIYDNFGRLVLTQDANQRALNKWAFVKYDINGRAVMTGLYMNATTTGQANMQTLVNGLTPQYEKRGNTLYGYTNNGFPTTNADNSALEIYTATYFDTYGFTFNNGTTPAYDNAHLAGLPANATSYTKGKVTGSRKLIIGTSNWIVAAVFYDNFGRVIQTQGNNHLNLNGLDKSSAVYDFEKVTQTKTTHSPDGLNVTMILQTPVYGTQGQLSQLKHSINGAADQIVAQYQYNELGQVVTKQLHNTGSSNYLQNVDLLYNIRGWLTNINDAQLSDATDYFGMELLYNTAQTGLNDQATDTIYFNGNASAIKWKNAGAASGAIGQRSYKFHYDHNDRLLGAVFQKSSSGSVWDQEGGTLNEVMTYDKNGNIASLQRYQNQHGLNGTTVTSTAQQIDNLTYTYLNNANQLKKVDDGSGNGAGFANGTNGGDDYTYDPQGAGNVIADQNKGISNIIYNALGKAQQISFTDGRVINYTYDAGGNKLTMAATVGGTTTTTDYANGFVYNTSGAAHTLTFFSSPEGRVVKKGSSYEYQYAITDHQGNTRVVFTSAAPTAQATTATFETANQSMEGTQFNNYGHISAGHASTTPGNSQYLNGSSAGMVGVAKSYKVYPGDQLKIEAYGSYNTPGSGPSGLVNFAPALIAAFGVPTPGPSETGTASSALNTWGGIEAGGYGDGTPDVTDPKAFVNIVLFDKNYNFLDVTYAQLKGTSLYYMTASYTVKEAGYAYLYVSNEQPVQTDVYFDDVTMTYTPSNIIQSSEYYPFGLLTSNSWTRDNAVTNNFLFDAGNELNSTTGFYDLPYRNYDASLGRFFQVDPLSHTSHTMTPYHYAGNNPIGFNDPTGLFMNAKYSPGDGNHNGTPDWAEQRNADVDALYGYGGGGGGGGGGSGGGAYESEYYDAALVNGGWMTQEEYAAKYSSGDYWLVYNEGESEDGKVVGTWSLYGDRTYWDDEGSSFSSKGVALAFGVYKNGYGSEYWAGKEGDEDEVPLISNFTSNVTGGITGVWGGGFSWGAEEAARLGTYTTKALKIAKAGGNVLGVLGAVPSTYNTVAKTINGTVNTADLVDLGATGALLVTGFLVTNPIGLGVLAIGGIGYAIYRIGWGDDADQWINENFGFNNRPK